MTNKHTIGWQELTAAGFKVHKGYRGRFYLVTAPDGESAVVLRQARNCWHYFANASEATASGSTAAECMRGGLGDVIGTDGEMRTYRRLMFSAPGALLRASDGLYRGAIQVAS